MKQYNCPDCMVGGDTCDYCQRAQLNKPHDNFLNSSDYTPVPECCRYCTNHPSNGGSGICNCVLPYMTSTGAEYQPYITTSSTYIDNKK